MPNDTQTAEAPEWLCDDPYAVCGSCGGAGVHEDECECGDDPCCCLVPTPPVCVECGGAG
jgi:hypothetical protein